MIQRNVPPTDSSPWSFALSLLIAGSALATHPLWLPELQSAWYGSSDLPHSPGCKHVHLAPKQDVEPWTLPVRAARKMPQRPVFTRLEVPLLPLPQLRAGTDYELALTLPTPRFEPPRF